MADEPRTRPTDEDIGKDVYDESGERLGELSAVEGNSLVVDSDPSLTERIKTTLGWGDTQDVYRIDEPNVERITEGAVHVRSGTGESMGAGTGSRGETAAGTGTDEGMTTTGTDEGLTSTGTDTEDRSTAGTDASPGREERGTTDMGTDEPAHSGTEMDESSHRGAGEPPTPDDDLGTTDRDESGTRDDAGMGDSTTTLGETGPAGGTGDEMDTDVGDEPGEREPRGMASDEREGERADEEPSVMDERTTDLDEDDEEEGLTDDELRDAGDGS